MPIAHRNRGKSIGLTLAIVIFVLAALPRLAVVFSGIAPYASDAGTYLEPARNLAAGRGYVDDTGAPYAFRPPTYPLFLAAIFTVTGESHRTAMIVQAVLAAAGAAALAVWIAWRHGLGAGGAAGALVALDPLLVPVPAFILTEALGTILVAGVVVCVQEGLTTRSRAPFALAGILGGAAALNTPITLLLVPWLLLVAGLFRPPRRPDWRTCALALGLAAACVGAWTARNALVKGNVVVVRDNGFGSLVWATTEYDFDWLASPYAPDWSELKRKYDALAAGHTDEEAHSIFLRAAWRNFRDRPFLVLKRVAKANFWFWVEVPGHHVAGPWPWIRRLTLGFHLAQLLALGAAIWILHRAGRLRAWALWIGTIVYFAVFLGPMMPIPRYYTPLLPVMDTVIAAGLTLAPRFRPAARRTDPSGGWAISTGKHKA